MAKNFFKRYIWLVDLINRRKYVSFKEISEAWMRSPLNETGDPLSERTFFNHKDAIAGMFGIEILNDRSLGFYIGRSDVGSDETSDWMLHTVSEQCAARERGHEGPDTHGEGPVKREIPYGHHQRDA